jgi:hypothetical protein
MGGFFGATTVTFEAKAGIVYKVRAKLEDDDKPWYAKSIYAAGGPTAFWVEEIETGKVVSDKAVAYVTVERQPTLYIPVIPRQK